MKSYTTRIKLCCSNRLYSNLKGEVIIFSVNIIIPTYNEKITMRIGLANGVSFLMTTEADKLNGCFRKFIF